MSATNCDICGMDWKHHGTACVTGGQKPERSFAPAPRSARRLQITGSPAVLLADDKAVTRHLAAMQPKWKERAARAKRVHLLDWCRNQGERSRLLVRNGYIIGRIDCVPNAQGELPPPRQPKT